MKTIYFVLTKINQTKYFDHIVYATHYSFSISLVWLQSHLMLYVSFSSSSSSKYRFCCIFITNANGFACYSQIQNEFISSSRFIIPIKVYWSLPKVWMTGRLFFICLCAFSSLKPFFLYENGIESIEFTHNIHFILVQNCMHD